MKKFVLFISLFITSHVFSQIPLTMAPSGGNKKAMVSEQVGFTNVSVTYSRPAVKGREGKIWSELIPVGFTDPGFGSTKSAPWRAGANQNTVVEFSTDVTIEGRSLPAGKYGFFIAYNPNECTLIFSKNASSWGSYYYNPAEDALRVTVKPIPLNTSVEWLKYEFSNQTANSAVVQLQWEKLSIPFKIEVDNISQQVAGFRNELRSERGFMWESWNLAAQWCAQNNTNLDEALLWADSATSVTFGGNQQFPAWATKAAVLEKLGRTKEAEEVMKKALPLGSVIEVHQYGRQLLQQKKVAEAMTVFKTNFDKHPNQFTTYVGLARGYSANGEYSKALKNAGLALPLAPDALNKKSVEDMIVKLKAGKDVN